jgi:hypothetical protein
MALSEDLVARLTPPELPRGDRNSAFDVDADVEAAAAIRDSYEDSSAYRRWAWTQWMLRRGFADRVIELASEFAGTWYVGVGLIPRSGLDLEFDSLDIAAASRESGYVWGGIIMHCGLEDRALRDQLSYRKQLFPILLRSARTVDHALEIHDSAALLGTATCRARSLPLNSLPGGKDGVLTAKHVVRGRSGIDLISASRRHPLSIARLAPLCIDAAFLEGNWRPPSSPRPPFIPAMPASISSGDPAAFTGAISTAAARITHISAHARYTGSAVPMIVCYDRCGQPGDSGALVTTIKDSPLAIHLGKIHLDNHAGQESYALLLHQAQALLGIELYS